MKKVVVYARYSSDNQRQESIEAQLYAISNYCENLNYEIIETYIDKEVSATTDDRDSFLRMIEESKILNYDFVVVHKLDRFARNRYDSAIYKKKLEQNNKRVVSVLENLDDSPESIMLESVLEGMAEYYSKNLAREVKKGMELNARSGLHTGGKPPYGYDVIKKKYIPNIKESKIVSSIFNMYNQGYGLRAIAKHLNDLGIKNKHGRDFNHTSIYYLLRNKHYIGTYEYQPQPKGKKRNNNYRDDNLILIENNHEAIIELSIWKETQKKIGEVKPRMNNKSKTYHLTGKLECGECGASYHGNGWDGKRFTYVCTNHRTGCKNKKVNAIKLEQFVIDTIRNEYLQPDQIENSIRDAASIIKEYIDDSRVERKQITKEIDEIDDKINQLFDTFLEIGLDKDILNEQTNRYKTKRERLSNRLETISTNTENLDINIIYDLFNIMKSIDLNSSDDKIQMLIDRFVDKIIIHSNGNIQLKLLRLSKIVGGNVEAASPAPKTNYN